MPHVTMVYPFRPREQFDEVSDALQIHCHAIASFQIQLAEFRYFQHGKQSFTLYLAPEPADPLVKLQKTLVSAVPDCDDTSRHAQGFTPHLSVGQVRGYDRMMRLGEDLQGNWAPLAFKVNEVSLIWRNTPPDDIFRMDRTIPLCG
jgi:2'-5' RNA ligase